MTKTMILTTALALLGTAAVADTPNRTTMGFVEFVGASGCKLVDKGGYSNIASVTGGPCEVDVVRAYVGGNSKTIATTGADGVFGTADDGQANVSDN